MPSPPPELRYRINSTNCECDRLDIDSTPMNCTCQNNELVLFWGQASGNFDVQHYTVGISGAENNTTTNVSSTFFSVHVTSGLKYCVHVSTVSMCDQMSDAAVPEDSMDGCINIGKYLNFVSIVCQLSYQICGDVYSYATMACSYPFLLNIYTH